MKPLFTIHAGEYLVGNELEKRFKNCEVWIPSKDNGTDLLVTNAAKRDKNVGLQVKFSKDFLPEMNAKFHAQLSACGWWTLNSDKIANSNADLWILTPYSFQNKSIEYVIISPKLLLERLIFIHGKQKAINTYLWITKDQKCFETRGLNKKETEALINNELNEIDKNRDFSVFLNDWKSLENKLI